MYLWKVCLCKIKSIDINKTVGFKRKVCSFIQASTLRSETLHLKTKASTLRPRPHHSSPRYLFQDQELSIVPQEEDIHSLRLRRCPQNQDICIRT